jgi:transposase
MTTELNQKYPGLSPASASKGSAAERSEAARTVEALAGVAGPVTLPDPEVSGRPHRRTFSAEYRARILEEIGEGATPVGQILRREGLYSSQVAVWRKADSKLRLAAQKSKPRGPKPRTQNPFSAENAELRRETSRLKKKLRKAELIIDFQKKVSQLLGIALPIFEDENEEQKPGEGEDCS